MLQVDIRPTHQLVYQVAEIERFVGSWQRLAQNALLINEEQLSHARLEELYAISQLDDSIPPPARHAVENLIRETPFLERLEVLEQKLRFYPIARNCLQAHSLRSSFHSSDYLHLHSMIASGTQVPSELRREASKFRSQEGELIFLTTAGFLVETRLEQILEWTRSSIAKQEVHPLIALGVCHLLLLQLSPFDSHSHATALLFTSTQLAAHGYEFVHYASPVRYFAKNREQYFTSLRQAEKTAGNTWASINSWLEFFLSALCEGCERIQTKNNAVDKTARLTSVQREILEVVREHGRASRDLIVSSTGINTSTVKYNLSLLAAHGVLRRSGGGRSTSYSVL